VGVQGSNIPITNHITAKKGYMGLLAWELLLDPTSLLFAPPIFSISKNTLSHIVL